MENEISIPKWSMIIAYPVCILILALSSLELMFDNISDLFNR